MDNPRGVAPQELMGTCTEMCPAAFVHEITSELEIHAGQPVYPMKQFKRTVNKEVGNTAPECWRTKAALHMSMETLWAWLRGVKCVPFSDSICMCSRRASVRCFDRLCNWIGLMHGVVRQRSKNRQV
jgi:hypothetical protein